MTAPADEPSLDLSTVLADVRLPSPVMTAAGCAGSGRELAQFFDVTELGALVTRSVTRDTTPHRPGARVTETASGVLSDLRPTGAGIDSFLATDLPWLAQRRARVVVSIAGSTLEEYAELARRAGNSPGVTALEVNLLGRASDSFQAAKIVSVVRRETAPGVPVLVKVAADVTTVVDVAHAAVESGADGLVVGGRLRALTIDRTTLRPVVDDLAGGLSGPAVRPVVLRCVWDVHVAIPHVAVVASGGVRCGLDAWEYLLAGASAVQVGTVTFHDPYAPLRVRDELSAVLGEHGFARAVDAVGHAHRQP